MKTKEELNALKEEFENLNAKLAELSEEELDQIEGGLSRILWDEASAGLITDEIVGAEKQEPGGKNRA